MFRSGGRSERGKGKKGGSQRPTSNLFAASIGLALSGAYDEPEDDGEGEIQRAMEEEAYRQSRIVTLLQMNSKKQQPGTIKKIKKIVRQSTRESTRASKRAMSKRRGGNDGQSKKKAGSRLLKRIAASDMMRRMVEDTEANEGIWKNVVTYMSVGAVVRVVSVISKFLHRVVSSCSCSGCLGGPIDGDSSKCLWTSLLDRDYPDLKPTKSPAPAPPATSSPRAPQKVYIEEYLLNKSDELLDTLNPASGPYEETLDIFDRGATKCKLVLVGNTQCGKTALLHRFVNGVFLPSCTPTIGSAYSRKDHFGVHVPSSYASSAMRRRRRLQMREAVIRNRRRRIRNASLLRCHVHFQRSQDRVAAIAAEESPQLQPIGDPIPEEKVPHCRRSRLQMREAVIRNRRRIRDASLQKSQDQDQDQDRAAAIVAEESPQLQPIGDLIPEEEVPQLIEEEEAMSDNRITRGVQLDCWDTTGQRRFRSVVPMYCADAHGVLVCYSVTDPSSFRVACGLVSKLATETCPGASFVLVGTKCDAAVMSGVKNIVDAKSAKETVEAILAKTKVKATGPLVHFECSAKTGKGVEEVFRAVAHAAVCGILEKAKGVDPAFHGGETPGKPKEDVEEGVCRLHEGW